VIKRGQLQEEAWYAMMKKNVQETCLWNSPDYQRIHSHCQSSLALDQALGVTFSVNNFRDFQHLFWPLANFLLEFVKVTFSIVVSVVQ
jgi:hypothetical protein